MNVADTEDGWRRVIVEKPFGTSLETAQELNKHLCRIFADLGIHKSRIPGESLSVRKNIIAI